VPPVKPVAKRSMSCLSVLGVMALMTSALGVLVVSLLRL
jgi:hypothetical protein